ncbi:class I glutamine amidotransferase-like protein [Byssothecium circinans]|uniref:Class I glutamine amidotransferase-like protein n=1 Tax=Byssothecium circinans TaxID=147558 RepID=A0A6A5THB6_9PLEO|nr:class I glutamine amidotransferase-like protein [Byssothecium circinans]
MPHIGVLLVPPIQLLDLSPIDLFAMTTHSYFAACKLPSPLLSTALPDDSLTITYISAQHPTPAATTARLSLSTNAELSSPSVAPGTLDILMIPGPPPGMRPEEEVLQFVRGHVDAGVDLLTICSGVFVAGFAGVLDGKKVAGLRGVQGLLDKAFPEVEWVDRRYVQDGKVWSSGGITNGMDMVAVYMKNKWPGPLSDTVLALADVEVRPAEYGQGKVGFIASFMLLIARAWFRGLTSRKKIE